MIINKPKSYSMQNLPKYNRFELADLKPDDPQYIQKTAYKYGISEDVVKGWYEDLTKKDYSASGLAADIGKGLTGKKQLDALKIASDVASKYNIVPNSNVLSKGGKYQKYDDMINKILSQGKATPEDNAIIDKYYREIMLDQDNISDIEKYITASEYAMFLDKIKNYDYSPWYERIGKGLATAVGNTLYAPATLFNKDFRNVYYSRTGDLQQQATAGFSEAGATAWNIGSSIAQNIVNYTLFGGLAPAALGIQAGTQKVYDVEKAGGTAFEAWSSGLMAAAAEFLGEKVSFNGIQKLAKTAPSTMKKIVTSVAGQILTEAPEEMATEVINILSDSLFLDILDKGGAQSDLQKYFDNYLKEHPEAKNNQALWNTLGQALKQIGMAGLAGAVSGGVMGGGRIALNAATSQGRQNIASQGFSEAMDNAYSELKKGGLTPQTQNKVANAQNLLHKRLNDDTVVKPQDVTNESVKEYIYQRDFDKYGKTDTEKASIKQAVLNDKITKEELENIKMFSEKTKSNITFNFASNKINGYIKNGNIVINLNAKNKAFNTAVHEYTHNLKDNSPEQFTKLVQAVTGLKQYQNVINEVTETYTNAKETEGFIWSIKDGQKVINQESLNEEITARITEEIINNPSKFLEDISNKTVIKRIASALKSLYERAKDFFSASDKKKVREAYNTLVRVIKENKKAETKENKSKNKEAFEQIKYALNATIIADIKKGNDYTDLLPNSENKKFLKEVNHYSYPTKVYRGMEAEEFDFIFTNNYIKSKGDYNFNYQAGRTSFTADPMTAFSYATSFAPSEIRDKFFEQGMPAYIMEINNAPELNMYMGGNEKIENYDNPIEEFSGVGELFSEKEISVSYISKIYELMYDAKTDKVNVSEVKLPKGFGTKNETDVYKPSLYKDKTTGTILMAIKDRKGVEQGYYISEADTYMLVNYEKFNEKWRQEATKISGNKNDLVKFNNNNNTKYSLQTDSEGNKLTKEQAEFFKDSKVRDEKGNLLVVYHGSGAEFFTFDEAKKGGSSSTAKVGFWFGNKNLAEDFAINAYYSGDNPKTISAYLNIKNPKIYTSEEKAYNDAYQKLRTDIRKFDYTEEEKTKHIEYWGKEIDYADLANIGGLGMVFKNNESKVTKAYVDDLKSKGYDGIVVKDTYFDGSAAGGINTQYVAFNPNQIKLTTNLSPTGNEDIRYSLDKKYTRKDAEQILETALIQTEGSLIGKDLKETLDTLYNGLKAEEGSRGKVALQIADLIIENAVIIEYTTKTEALSNLNAFKDYYHKLDLKDYKGEIKNKYNNLKMFTLWNKNNGLNVEDVFNELKEKGITIAGNTPDDQIVNMFEMQKKAVEDLKAESKLNIKKYIPDVEAVKQKIAREILLGYDKYGKPSATANLIKKYNEKISEIRQQLKDLKARNKAINNLMSSIDRVIGLEKYKSADVQLAKEVVAIVRMLKKAKTYRGNLSKNIRDVMLAYSKKIDGKEIYNLLAEEKNPMAEFIEDIAKGKGELSTDELRMLDKIMLNFIHNAKEYDRVFFEGKTQQAEELAQKAINETSKVRPIENPDKLTTRATQGIRKYNDWVTAPVHRFERLGMYDKDSFSMQEWEELRQAQNKQAEFNQKVDEHYKDFFKKYGKQADKWRTETLKVGTETISKGQAISLFMSSLREQARLHLFPEKKTGVIRVTNERKYQNTKEALAQGKDVEITEADVLKLYKEFGEAELEFIELTEQFFNRIAKEAKVETDRQLYGVTNAEESKYFPIRVSNDQIYTDVGKEEFTQMFNMYNPSFNKSTKPKSDNKIVIENVLDVVNRHKRQMGVYYGYANTIKSFNKVYNRKVNGTTLRQEITKKDSGFEKYINKLFEDVQGKPMTREGYDRLVSKVRGWGARAALGLNPKVWVNQVVSLFAARGNGVAYKNIAIGAKNAVKGKKTDYELLYKYSPMLYERSKEGSNIDVGLLKEGNTLGRIDKFTDITTAPISKMDNLVVFAVWNACLEQTKNQYKSYSEEHYKAAAKLTEETVIKTQANYISLYRPEILRSQSSALQLSTMFMSEPLQVYSQIVATVDKYRTAKYIIKNAQNEQEKAKGEKLLKESKKQAAGAATSIIVDGILLTLIAQLFKWVKGKKEEDKLADMANDFLGNYVGMFPLVRDIYTLFEGYEISNMYESGLKSIKDGLSGLDFFITGDIDKLRKIILGTSQMFGIPTKNFEGYVMGIIDKFSPATAYKYYNLFYNQTYNKDLKKAVENKDDKMAKVILESMIKDKGINANTVISNELFRLYKKGYNNLPKAVNNKITFESKEYLLSGYQFNMFKNIYNNSTAVITSLINSQQYKQLDDEEKSKAINSVYDIYYSKALKSVLNLDDGKSLVSKVMPIKDFSLVYGYYTGAETDKTANGVAINGSKKEKVLDYINKTSLTQNQKLFLMLYFGYTVDDSKKRIVKNYIKSLSMRLSEKEALIKKLGV